MRVLISLSLLLAACDGGELVIKGEDPDPTLTTPSTEPSTNTTTATETTTTTDTGDVPLHTGDTGAPVAVDLPDYVVDCNGGGDFTTIQDAIEGAQSGDRIGVEPCTYVERIDYLGKTLDIYGILGSAFTIIDGDDDGTVVNVESGESLGTRLAGFTIIGGDGSDDDDGSAIEVELSSLELEDIILEDNGDSNAVLYGQVGWITATDLIIRNNDVESQGQGIYTKGGSLTLTRADIDCSTGNQAIWHHNSLLMIDSVVYCAGDYGIQDYHGEENIRRSEIWGGSVGILAYDVEDTEEEPDNPNEKIIIWNSSIGGGDIGLETRYVNLEVGNCVISGSDAALSMLENHVNSEVRNSSLNYTDCGIRGDQPFEDSYNAYFGSGNAGCGVSVSPAVSSDPMFAAPPTDLSLLPGSPLIDAGDPLGFYNDLDGSRCDIGVTGGWLPL